MGGKDSFSDGMYPDLSCSRMSAFGHLVILTVWASILYLTMACFYHQKISYVRAGVTGRDRTFIMSVALANKLFRR